MIRKHNKVLNLAIITLITSIIILLINVSSNQSLDLEPNGFFYFLMYCLFIIQLLPVIGIVIGIIQIIKHKKLNFTGKQLRNIIIGFLINLIWFSGFVTLIVFVIMSL
jgi:hypothetical protein